MLDPHRLRIFRSVVASGSIQAAAHHLGYTPSAVSQHVAALQREVGLSLIEKSGRGISPTAAGKALAAESDDVIASLTRLNTVVADLREGRTGRLTIGYFSSAGMAWMPQVARALKDEFPQLVLELILNEVPREDDSHQPDLDLFVESPQQSRPVPSGYRRSHLTDDPYVVVVAREHPFASRPSVTMAELADEALIDSDVTGGFCHRVTMSACSAAGFIPQFSVQAQDHYTAIAFAARGVGVTIVPQLCTHDLPAATVAVPLTDPEPVRRISLLVRESVANSPVVVSAVRLLVERANDTVPALL